MKLYLYGSWMPGTKFWYPGHATIFGDGPPHAAPKFQNQACIYIIICSETKHIAYRYDLSYTYTYIYIHI